jgi:hypothetical protein
MRKWSRVTEGSKTRGKDGREKVDTGSSLLGGKSSEAGYGSTAVDMSDTKDETTTGIRVSKIE